MKVKLLKDAALESLSEVNFPVEVDAIFDRSIKDRSAIFVPSSELIRIGGRADLLSSVDYRYFIDDQFEVVE